MPRVLSDYCVRVASVTSGVYNTLFAASVLRGNAELFSEGILFPQRAGRPTSLSAW